MLGAWTVETMGLAEGLGLSSKKKRESRTLQPERAMCRERRMHR